jgi:hypothetical protein
MPLQLDKAISPITQEKSIRIASSSHLTSIIALSDTTLVFAMVMVRMAKKHHTL